MRKPPEFRNDAAVLGRKSQQLRIAQRRIERHAAVLIGHLLRMHERQIEKLPHRFVGRLVEAARERPVRHGTRQRIGGERAGAVAKHIARKLVEQDDKRERSFRAFFERRELGPCRGLVRCQKSPPDRSVEIVIPVEPSPRPCRAPERYDFGCCNLVHLRCARRMRQCGTELSTAPFAPHWRSVSLPRRRGTAPLPCRCIPAARSRDRSRRQCRRRPAHTWCHP